MKDQSKIDLGELMEAAHERDAERLPLRITNQIVVLVDKENFNEGYRVKKARQFGEPVANRGVVLSRRERSDIDTARIVKMHEAGTSVTDIAQEVGLSKTAIYIRLKKAKKND